jgi:hypothetical protein
MWHRVDLVNWTDVSEEHIASIFRVEKSAIEEPAWASSSRLVPRSPIFLPWRWRRYVPPKRWFNSQDLHGATSQKTAFFVYSYSSILKPCWKRFCSPHRLSWSYSTWPKVSIQYHLFGRQWRRSRVSHAVSCEHQSIWFLSQTSAALFSQLGIRRKVYPSYFPCAFTILLSHPRYPWSYLFLC